MYDFGKPHRQAFLEEELINRKHEKQAHWLLLITSTYVIIHIAAYFWRNYL